MPVYGKFEPTLIQVHYANDAVDRLNSVGRDPFHLLHPSDRSSEVLADVGVETHRGRLANRPDLKPLACPSCRRQVARQRQERPAVLVVRDKLPKTLVRLLDTSPENAQEIGDNCSRSRTRGVEQLLARPLLNRHRKLVAARWRLKQPRSASVLDVLRGRTPRAVGTPSHELRSPVEQGLDCLRRFDDQVQRSPTLENLTPIHGDENLTRGEPDIGLAPYLLAPSRL